MRNRHRIAMSLLCAAYIVAAAGSLYPAYTAFVGLSALPQGTRIRPMGLALLIVVFALVGFLLVSLLSGLAIVAEKNKKTIWLGLGAVLLRAPKSTPPPASASR